MSPKNFKSLTLIDPPFGQTDPPGQTPHSIDRHPPDRDPLGLHPFVAIEFFTVNTKLPPVGFDLMQEIITSLRVQCLTN